MTHSAATFNVRIRMTFFLIALHKRIRGILTPYEQTIIMDHTPRTYNITGWSRVDASHISLCWN